MYICIPVQRNGEVERTGCNTDMSPIVVVQRGHYTRWGIHNPEWGVPPPNTLLASSKKRQGAGLEVLLREIIRASSSRASLGCRRRNEAI